MWIVLYKYKFEPANEISFDTETEANDHAEWLRGKGWEAIVVRK